jgi:hypothetical protein
VPVVARAELATSGFTQAHLAGVRHIGVRLPSNIPVEVRRLLAGGEPFVYAYYDGIDKTAHEFGLREHYDAELVAADRLVGDLLAVLPPGAALVVTADHGQVEVPTTVPLAPAAVALSRLLSGEGRFRWLHARPGAAADVLAAATAAHASTAWVVSVEQVVDEGWLGPRIAPPIRARLGDVAVVAREPVSFNDPADTGQVVLICRHGSLTEAEVRVPLLVGRPA